MKFSSNKYNAIIKEDINLFNKREIIFNSSQGSCLEVENTILTLENLQIFCTKKDLFFEKLKDKRFAEKTILEKYNLFYKWIINFLTTNKNEDRAIYYIYSKGLLDHLKEASILFINEELNIT